MFGRLSELSKIRLLADLFAEEVVPPGARPEGPFVVFDTWLPADHNGPFVNAPQPGLLPYLRPHMLQGDAVLRQVQKHLYGLLVGQRWFSQLPWKAAGPSAPRVQPCTTESVSPPRIVLKNSIRPLG